MQNLNVFVSSTCYDLKQIRKDLSEFLSNAGYHPIMSEYDTFPVDPDSDTVSNCIQNVELADVFILLIGGRYGYVLDNDKSITNMEYIYAGKKGIPIFIYINRELINGLSMYKDNPSANFKSLVDDTKVFDFVNEVRETNQQWCYDFEHAQDITSNLKIRFSHLFADSLKIRSSMQSVKNDELWRVISPDAVAIVLRKDKFYELKFFHQVLNDEIRKYQNLRFDQQYEVFLGYSNKISSCKETISFLELAFHEVRLIVESAGNIMNKAFKYFWGEVGVPSDLYGLYYVSNRLAKVYAEMLTWSSKIRSTEVPEYFEYLKSLTADYNKLSAECIWNYPARLQEALETIDKAPDGGEVLRVSVNMEFDIDQDLIEKQHEELARLSNFFAENPELYN